MYHRLAPAVSGTASPGRTISRRGAAAPLQAPTRNRYFYGKLLDVYHLELEQRYFLEQRRMLNRLTVGYGVVCGLEVTLAADGKGVVIAPGFAIDGLGREIVVTEPIQLADPAKLTDDCGRPAGEATEDTVTLCLAYHECETEPTPMLVSDCDVRESCTNGAVRERYALLVHDGAPDAPPYDPADIVSVCRLLASRVTDLVDAGKATGKPSAPSYVSLPAERAMGGISMAGGLKPGAYALNPRDAASSLLDCAPPEEDCVVLATVTLAAGAEPAGVDAWTHRRIVLSNDRLFEAVLCLAATVEKCCGQTKDGYTIKVVSGNNKGGMTNASLKDPIVVEVTGADGKPVENETVTFAVTSTLGGSFDAPDQTTDAKGRASASWTLGSAGRQTAVARTSGGDSVDLTATAKD